MTYNEKRYSDKDGFTLLEAMIALAIIALIIGTGGFTIFQIRNTVELNNGHSDILSYIRTVQSRARNSIANGTVDSQTQIPNSPDLYSLRFNENSIDLLSCSLSGTSINCNLVEGGINESALSRIEVSPDCFGIGFRRSTNDILELINNNTVSNSGFCDIEIGHTNNSSNKIIRIDFVDNSIIGDLNDGT